MKITLLLMLCFFTSTLHASNELSSLSKARAACGTINRICNRLSCSNGYRAAAAFFAENSISLFKNFESLARQLKKEGKQLKKTPLKVLLKLEESQSKLKK